MFEHETFRHAPITEALLDVRVALPSGTDLTALDAFTAAVSDRFPEKQTRHFYKGGLEVKAEGPPQYIEPTVESVGYLYRSENNDKVVQGRLDGFSFSKLRPYTNWEMFRDEAHELWNLYRELLKPVKITRVALRYINRIEIPLPVRDFRDYVLTSPEIAPDIPQAVINFFFRVFIPDPDINAVAIITSTIERTEEDSEILPYIFDIDAFRQVDLEPQSHELWEIFETLRDYKNRIFFNSITERAKELFR